MTGNVVQIPSSRKVMKNRRTLLLGILIFIFAHTTDGVYIKHLGCYEDNAAEPDLPIETKIDTDLSPDNCAAACSNLGYPFCGLRAMSQCLCGMMYGKYSLSDACNYTCGDAFENYCGGVETNSIYYSVDSDPVTRVQRNYYVYVDEPLSYEDARKQCVKYNGDLAVTSSNSDLADVKAVVADVKDSGKTIPAEVWMGLARRVDDLLFKWTDPTSHGFEVNNDDTHWTNSETYTENCVVLIVDTLKIATRACPSTLPYVCKHTKQANSGGGGAGGDYDDTAVTVETEAETSTNNVVFYVVLPLFIFCYGGSCLIYAIGKSYRYFKWSRRQKRLEERMVEFEPDTKPMISTDTPPPYYKMASRTPVTPLIPEGRPISPLVTRQRTPQPAPSHSDPYREEKDENTIDFSKLSIQDIIYIKSLMGERRPAKKKKVPTATLR